MEGDYLWLVFRALRPQVQIRGFATQCKIPTVMTMIDKVDFISYKVIIVNPNKIASPNLLQVVNINGG